MKNHEVLAPLPTAPEPWVGPTARSGVSLSLPCVAVLTSLAPAPVSHCKPVSDFKIFCSTTRSAPPLPLPPHLGSVFSSLLLPPLLLSNHVCHEHPLPRPQHSGGGLWKRKTRLLSPERPLSGLPDGNSPVLSPAGDFRCPAAEAGTPQNRAEVGRRSALQMEGHQLRSSRPSSPS